jgi:UDP-N-acetylglucosamine transferase subunit ALG13
MIFVTVGSQLPFDRMVSQVDAWAETRPEVEIFGQVGDTKYPPRHFESVSTMSPEEYQRRFAEADLIVGHAGMGTIIAALELRKPLLMLARLGSLHESRNDNQVGTARHFKKFSLFEVVDSEAEIPERLSEMTTNLDRYRNASDAFGVGDSLIDAIAEFVNT